MKTYFTLPILAIALIVVSACESPLAVDTPRIKTPIGEELPPGTLRSNWIDATIQFAGVEYFPEVMTSSAGDVVRIDTTVFPPIVRMDVSPQFIQDQGRISYPVFLRLKVDSLQLRTTAIEVYSLSNPGTSPQGYRMEIVYASRSGVVRPVFIGGEPFIQDSVSMPLPALQFNRAWPGIRNISGSFQAGLVYLDQQPLDTRVQVDFTITW